MMRRRQCALLVPALLRALPRTQLAAVMTAAVVIVWLLGEGPDSARTALALQLGALALSFAVASILDESAAGTLAAVPPTLLWRRALTIALVLPAVVVAWAALVALSGVPADVAGAITLQLGAFVLLTLALATALPRGGAVAGPLVALAFVGIQPVGPRWLLRPELGEWRWDATWAGLGAGALAALLLVSRDPARRRQGLTLLAPPVRRPFSTQAAPSTGRPATPATRSANRRHPAGDASTPNGRVAGARNGRSVVLAGLRHPRRHEIGTTFPSDHAAGTRPTLPSTSRHVSSRSPPSTRHPNTSKTTSRSPAPRPAAPSPATDPQHEYCVAYSPGTGKTHVAVALGIRACLAGQRVAFKTATEWVTMLRRRPTPRPP